jgi:hypothetical protein
MTDKEIYKELWEAYTNSDKLEFLKDYINAAIRHIDKNEYTMYDQLHFRRDQLEIILKGLEKL